MQMNRSKWFLPLFSVGLGFAMLAALWIGGDPGVGVFSLGVMMAFGALILFGGRSETIRGLRGDGRDDASVRSTSSLRPSPASRSSRRSSSRSSLRYHGAMTESLLVARCDWRRRIPRRDSGVAPFEGRCRPAGPRPPAA